MHIQIRAFEGVGDPLHPGYGTPMCMDQKSFVNMLLGKTVNGVTYEKGREHMSIHFEGGPVIWFVVTKGIPRILIQKDPYNVPTGLITKLK